MPWTTVTLACSPSSTEPRPPDWLWEFFTNMVHEVKFAFLPGAYKMGGASVCGRNLHVARGQGASSPENSWRNVSMLLYSLVPRPHPLRGKGSGDIRALSWSCAPALHHPIHMIINSIFNASDLQMAYELHSPLEIDFHLRRHSFLGIESYRSGILQASGHMTAESAQPRKSLQCHQTLSLAEGGVWGRD